MTTLRFWWSINNKNKDLLLCLTIYQQHRHKQIDCLLCCWYIINNSKWLCVFVDISSKTQRAHVQFCWYIITKRKVSYSVICVLMIYQQKSNWPLCCFIKNSLINQQNTSINPARFCLDSHQLNKCLSWCLPNQQAFALHVIR